MSPLMLPKFDPIELSPLDSRLSMLANGYEPIPVSGKRPLIDQWQSREINEEVVRGWSDMGPNTGMRTARTPVFDIDILDDEAAQVVQDLILERLGDKGANLVRVGLLPKRAIPTRTETPFPKITRALLAPDGTKHKIEVLADGQQVVVAGAHPDTQAPYAWRWGHSPVTTARDKLPLIDEKEAHLIADLCASELERRLGWKLAAGSTAAPVAETDNVVPFTPIAERIEKMQYGGEFPINDTLLAYSGDQLRNGMPCEDVIKDCLARAQKAYEEIPGDPQERPIWDWNNMRQQIEAMVYGYIKKYYKEQPRIVETLPAGMLEKWRAIERGGGTPNFQKRRYWGVEDEGPAEPLPEMDSHSPAEEPTQKASDQPKKYRFQVIDFEDMRPDDVSHYLVDELLPEKGIGMVWGKPKCLKSFFMLDVCFHVARGMAYHDRAVKQGGVVYCAFEGGYGYKKRVTALRQLHGLEGEPKGTTPLKIVPSSAPNLVKDHTQLVREVREQIGEMIPRIVVLDTLNKSLPGSESKDVDMAAYIRAAEVIRDAFDCLVIIVHHCGWDESRPRGHSSLPGAVDVQLKVERHENSLVVEVELMRDGPEGTRVNLEAQEVVVGMDEKAGKPLTSLVLVAADKPVEIVKSKGGRPDRVTPVFDRAFTIALKAHGETFQPHAGTPVFAVGEEHVRGFFNRYFLDGAGDEAKSVRGRREAFRRALEKQQDEGRILGERDNHNRVLLWRPIEDVVRSEAPRSQNSFTSSFTSSNNSGNSPTT